MNKLRKNDVSNEPFKLGARGYTNAPMDVELAMKNGPVIKDLIPNSATLIIKKASTTEKKRMQKAWERYRIKDSERGHRTSLSEKLKTPTRRFNTCTTLPENVYSWIKGKKNRANYLRDLLMREYKKTS